MKYLKSIFFVSAFVAVLFALHVPKVHAIEIETTEVECVAVGQTYKIQGMLRVTDTQSNVQGLKMFAASGAGVPFQNTLSATYYVNKADAFASNSNLPAGAYQFYFKINNQTVPMGSDDQITCGGNSPGSSAFTTAYTNVTLQPDPANSGKYVLKGSAVVKNAAVNDGTPFNPLYIKLKQTEPATSYSSSEATLAGVRKIGESFNFTVSNLSGTAYDYHALIGYNNQKIQVSDPQKISYIIPPQDEPPTLDTPTPPQDEPPTLDLDGGSTPKQLLANPLKVDSIQEFIAEILKILLIIAIPIIGVFIIIAGFRYVVARGNPEAISTAHKNLLFVVVGAGLILGCILVVDVITKTINDVQTDYNS